MQDELKQIFIDGISHINFVNGMVRLTIGTLIPNDDNTQSIISFRRIDEEGNEIIAVCNFVPVARTDYRIGVPTKGNYKVVFCSDYEKYGGITKPRRAGYKSENIALHGYDNSISIDIPAMSVTYLKVPEKSNKK